MKKLVFMLLAAIYPYLIVYFGTGALIPGVYLGVATFFAPICLCFVERLYELVSRHSALKNEVRCTACKRKLF